MKETAMPNFDGNAEAGILSCLMQKPSLQKEYEDYLSDEYFYQTSHKIIYGAIKTLIQRDGEVDLIKLASELQKTGDYDKVGGAGYINQIQDFVLDTQNFRSYVQIIIEHFISRKFVILLDAKKEDAQAKDKSLDEIFTEITNELKEYQQKLSQLTIRKRTVKEKLIEMTEEATNNGGGLPDRTIPTGFPKLDEVGYLTRKKQTILGARPSHAKTAFVTTISRNLALGGLRVCCVTSEWTMEDFIIDTIRQTQNIDNYTAITDFAKKAMNISTKIYEALDNIIIEDLTYSKVDMIQKFYKNHNEKKIDVLIIDQMTNIKDDTAGKNMLRTYEIEQILNELEKLTEEENISTLTLSQLNRECEKRDFPLPTAPDFRDSGAYEGKANTLSAFMRPEKYYYERAGSKGFDKKMKEITDRYGSDEKGSNLLLVNICKARKGETGVIPLYFQTPGTGIFNWESDLQTIREWNKEIEI